MSKLSGRYVVTPNFCGLLRKPELHLAHPLKYLKSENIGFKIMDIFKLADRMRSMRTNGASKNRDSCSPPPPAL